MIINGSMSMGVPTNHPKLKAMIGKLTSYKGTPWLEGTPIGHHDRCESRPRQLQTHRCDAERADARPGYTQSMRLDGVTGGDWRFRLVNDG